jgi:hypothetical protein
MEMKPHEKSMEKAWLLLLLLVAMETAVCGELGGT